MQGQLALNRGLCRAGLFSGGRSGGGSQAGDVSSLILGPLTHLINICVLACTFAHCKTRVLLFPHCLVHRDDRNTDEQVSVKYSNDIHL